MTAVEGKVHQGNQALDVLPAEAGSQAQFLEVVGRTRSQSINLDSLFNPNLTEILLGTVGDARLRPQTPIKVKMSVEGPQFIAQAVEFDEFGFGSNMSEAIRDLQRALVELYFTLDREQDHLGSELAKLRESLTVKFAMTK